MTKKMIKLISITFILIIGIAAFTIPGIYAGSQLFYDYPITFYQDSFYRTYSNHDGYRITVSKNTDSQNDSQYSIKSYYGGYGSDITKILNLETGVLSKIELNRSNNQTAAKDFAPPRSGGDKVAYLSLLKDLKKEVEHVEMGRGAGFGPDINELRDTNTYLRHVLYELEVPQVGKFNYMGMHLETGKNYFSIPDNLHPGMKVNLKVKYESPKDCDLLVNLSINAKNVAEMRYTMPKGEDVFKGAFTIPENVSSSDNAVFNFKMLPKADTNTFVQSNAVETSVPVKIKPPYHIESLYGYKDYSSTAVSYSLDYFIAKDMDIRLDLLDEQGNWIWGKQTTTKFENNGFATLYSSITDAKGLVIGKKYKLYAKILPVGGNWNQFVTEKLYELVYE